MTKRTLAAKRSEPPLASPRPPNVADYIQQAPPAGQAHLRQLYAILKSVAPEAQEAIKWGTPFFIEPRFLFSFSAHKAHLSFSPSWDSLEAFREALQAYSTTKHFLRIPYHAVLPQTLIRQIAEHRLSNVKARDDDSFW